MKNPPRSRGISLSLLALLLATLGGAQGLSTHSASAPPARHKPTRNPRSSHSSLSIEPRPYTLPNGWSISPIGAKFDLGDLPLNVVVSPSKKYLAIVNAGQSTQSIQVFSIREQKIISEVIIPKTWYGLAFTEDEKTVYASGGNDNMIRVYSFREGMLAKKDSIILGKHWPNQKIGPTGIAYSAPDHRLYVVTKEDSSLYVLNTETKSVIKQVKLGTEAFSCQLDPSHHRLYISLWGNKTMGVYDTQSQSMLPGIAVGDHPNDFVMNRAKTLLYVACANDNTVSVVDLQKNKVLETLSTTLYPSLLSGSTPDGLCLSADEKTLYIANADNNCLAVFDVSTPSNAYSKGFIPTGWYPTQVKTVGNFIYVANGKGFRSMANPQGPNPLRVESEESRHAGYKAKKTQYIGGLFKGSLSVFTPPNLSTQRRYTQQVYRNTPFKPGQENLALGEDHNPIPRTSAEHSPIHYVFYIIKENRTYDQVLGDLKEGNGDSSLCIFPEKITPNLHSLARKYVLLDNFYVDAEVSADGHNWSMAAYANDFVEKTWPTSYGRRGGNYDFEGTRSIAFPKDGFIWDYCQRAGVSYRTYGEFAEYDKSPLPSLKGHSCALYPGFDLSIKDADKERLWEKDFDSLEAKGSLPRFNTIRLGNDHTSGLRKGAYSPLAAVADNDLAVGQLVEHLSKSSIWKESVIFILEDDAQNGSDHVDAHRSPAFVIGPYVKQHSVIHTAYTTSGILRTMELILGLKPMSQYDAAATPLFACFRPEADPVPYATVPARYDVNARNLAYNDGAKRAEAMNFSKEDMAPDLELNQMIWQAIKGDHSPMPPPKRSAFVLLLKKSKKGD